MFGCAAGDDRLDAPFPELAAVFVVVVAAVGEQAVGALARPAELAANRPDAVDQGQQLGDVVAVAAGQADRERDSGRVGQQVVL